MQKCRKLVPLRSYIKHPRGWTRAFFTETHTNSSAPVVDGLAGLKRDHRSLRSYIEVSRKWGRELVSWSSSRFSSSTTDGEGILKQTRSLRVPTYMVWGADTDVGKTLVSAGLAHASAVSQVLSAKHCVAVYIGCMIVGFRWSLPFVSLHSVFAFFPYPVLP
jgi:hypothetical protein